MEKNIVKGNISNVGSVKIGDTFISEQPPLPKSLTVYMPRTSMSEIVGRDAELNDLHQRLFDNRQVVLVNGMGGIGKTILAQVYVDHFWDEYCHIVWISQLSENLINDFVNTAGLIDNLNIQSAGNDSKEIFLSILNELNRITEKPNLLIIDNANASLAEWANYLPHQPHWHILVTSREKIDKFDFKELDFLSEDEAAELFLRHYTHNDIPKSDIKDLVHTVDRHTLTIEILAKTAQRQRTEIASLKQAIQKDLKANIYIPHSGNKIERVTSYISSIFNLSKLSEDEVGLLKQFVCLPAVFHEYHLLKELIQSANDDGEDTFSERLEALVEKGWLLRLQDRDSYKIHLIIAEVVKKQKPIVLSEVKNLIDSVTGKLGIDQARDNPVDKFPWVPFGNALLTNFPKSGDADIAELQTDLAIVLRSLGDYLGAKPLLEKAKRSAEKNFGLNHPTTAIRYSNLAVVLKDLGDYQGAKILLEKILRSAVKNFGPEHPDTVSIYSNLALVLKELGELQRAKSLLEKALQSEEKNFGPEHPNTGIIYSNLALVLKELGEYQGAKTLFEKALLIDENNFGSEHPNTTVRYSNLGVILYELGDFQGARILLEKAMHDDEKIFGLEHPSTAIRYSNLALVLQALGDYQGAKSLLEKAMRSAENNFGLNHPTTAIRYSNLAVVLKDLGDYERARILLEKALLSDEKNFGACHPTTATRNSNLALVLYDLGDYQGAKTLLEKALRSEESNFNPKHPTTAIRYANLAIVLKALGDDQGAKILLQKAMRSYEKNLGADHPTTAILYLNLASLLYDLGEKKNASKLAKRALESFVAKLPQGHPLIEEAAKRYNSIKE